MIVSGEQQGTQPCIQKLKVKVAQSCLTFCYPMDYTVHGILQAKILEWDPFSRGSSQSRIESRSPALQAVSLPAESQGKPQSTGLCRLSLLQQIFQTQESNWGFLNCRWILYQLIKVSILPQIPLPSKLRHNFEQSSICYTVVPCWLSILNIIECTHPSQTP